MSGIWRWKTAQFAERKWWQHYLRDKDVPAYLEWKKNYWNNLLTISEKKFGFIPGGRILDAGCGPAGLFIALNSPQVTAFDPLMDQYEADLPHFKKTMYPSVTFVSAGIENAEFHHPFETIFCMNAINHVHDIQQSAKKLVELASPGASLLISIDAHNFSFAKRLFRLLPGDILHPHQYDLDEYKNLFIELGCTLEGAELLKHEFWFDHYLLCFKKST